MAEFIATSNSTIAVTNTEVSSSLVTVNSSPSSLVKVNGSGIYSGGIDISVTASIDGTCSGASGTATILPTAVYVKESGSLVNREGDSVEVSLAGGTTPSSGSCGFTVTVEITNAGQTKVYAS